MKNENENEVNYATALWWLKFYYGQLIQILNAVCSQQVFTPDENLNHYYVVVKLNVDKALSSPALSELKEQSPTLPIDVLSNEIVGWMDAWDNGARTKPENFYAEIVAKLKRTKQGLLISEHMPAFTAELAKSGDSLIPDVNAETNKVNRAVENYARQAQERWKKIIANVDFFTEQDALREQRLNPQRLIEQDGHGNFTYLGHPLQVSKGTIYWDILNIIFQQHDQQGITTYEVIEKRLLELGYEKTQNNEQRNKRIINALSDSQGLFYYAKYNNKDFENEAPDKRPIIDIIKGKGVLFYNPIIQNK